MIPQSSRALMQAETRSLKLWETLVSDVVLRSPLVCHKCANLTRSKAEYSCSHYQHSLFTTENCYLPLFWQPPGIIILLRKRRGSAARIDARQDCGCLPTRAAHPGLRLKKDTCTILATTAARHTIVLISLRCVQPSDDCHPLVVRHRSATRVLWQRSVKADRCSASDLTSLRAGRASVFVFTSASLDRLHHAGLQRPCSMANRAGTRCHVVLCRTSPPTMAWTGHQCEGNCQDLCQHCQLSGQLCGSSTNNDPCRN